MSEREAGYIHGYSDDEARRLIEQADFLAPWVLDGLDLDGVGRLLEIGIGVGAQTRLLRRRWPSMPVIGVDISDEQLTRARQVLADDLAAGAVELVRASATALPLHDGQVDGAFICFMLEHVPEPAAVLCECARVVAPGGRVWVTEVYNASLALEPTKPALDHYWTAFCAAQRAAGGHPNIGARLPELAAKAGLEVVSHRFIPFLGDARDPAGRAAKLRYFRALLRSAEPQLLAAGAFTPAELAEVWAAYDAIEAAPDALICYTGAKLEARVPRR
ncbi:MAG TPA: methyltransferase domain-containing protein [Polyangiaceae bacterium]